jgi:tRNA threonylcarbamoyladenosine biosynthesis protein TsaE
VVSFQLHLHNLGETQLFGSLLGNFAQAGDIYCLEGNLGAGKTAISQAIAKGLAVPPSTNVSSPSFAIMHEYQGRLPMYHMDFYRLGTADEVAELGLDEYFVGSGVCVIEWASKADDFLPEQRITLCFRVTGVQERELDIVVPDDFATKMKNLIDLFQVKKNEVSTR